VGHTLTYIANGLGLPNMVTRWEVDLILVEGLQRTFLTAGL